MGWVGRHNSFFIMLGEGAGMQEFGDQERAILTLHSGRLCCLLGSLLGIGLVAFFSGLSSKIFFGEGALSTDQEDK